MVWRVVPAGREGLQVGGWMDGWMDERGRVCPSEDVLHTHREEGHFLDPRPPLPSWDRKEPIFSARLFIDGVQEAGRKDREPHKQWWFQPCHHSTHSCTPSGLLVRTFTAVPI